MLMQWVNHASFLRRRITVLFHRTKDKWVIKVCAAMGFATREMNPEEWIIKALLLLVPVFSAPNSKGVVACDITS
jgi:hypothetical protein